MKEVTLKAVATEDKLVFHYLPAYARYIRENHLLDFIRFQLKGARELNTPLLKIFGDLPDEQIIEASIPSHTEFLIAAENNKLRQLLKESIKKWVSNKLELVNRDEIEAEDITQVSYLRKAAFNHFLPLYTSDITAVLGISRELDMYQLESDTLTLNTHIDILEKRILKNTEALRHNEEELLEAQEIADLGSFNRDLVNQTIEVSPQLLKILDIDEVYDFEHFINKVHPADKVKVHKAFDEAFKTGSYECEYRLETRDRGERIIWMRGIVRFEKEKPVGFKGTVMDVTEKHHMVQRLQRSEELYKQAQGISHLGNWSWDILFNRFSWSDELYRIYGIEPDTPMSYELFQSYVDPADAEKVDAVIKNSLETFEPFEFYYRVNTASGDQKIIQAHGKVLVDEGRPFKIIGTLQDVTQQQLVEKELRKSREFIQKITNTTPSLIASYNIHTGRYTFVNRSFKNMLGYDPEVVLDRGLAFFAEIIHPDDIEPTMEKNNRALEEANNNPPADGQEMVVDFKYRLRHINGEYRWMHTFGTIFDRNEHGKVEHLLNVTIDITDQENAEQLLQQRNMELQQSNASLEEYAYVASHDLKEPLRKIATFSDRLLATQKDQLTEDGKLYLHKIIESSRRMQKMISDLLSVSVISGNKEFETYSLGEILKDVKQTLEYKIEEKQAVITSDKLPAVKMVPSQMRQLFQNLLSNSLKFSKEGTRPEISVTHRYLNASEGARYNLAPAARYLQVDISDNGIGFDLQYASKIFSIFQRLHGKSEYEGTGIGLAICKKIAENHGGTIIANSVIGQGSTFTIIIPV